MSINRDHGAAIRHFMDGSSPAKPWLRSSEAKLFTKIGSSALLILMLSCAGVDAQVTSPRLILANTKFQAAEDFIARDHDRFVKETIQITEVEAPPFKEEKRGRLFAEMLRQSGLSDVEIDAEGNVIGLRKGVG